MKDDIVTQADKDLELWFDRRMEGHWIGHLAPILARHRCESEEIKHLRREVERLNARTLARPWGD